MKHRRLILATLLILMQLATSATESKAKNRSLSTAALSVPVKTRDQLVPQVEADLSAARAQLSAIKEYHSSMLDTVHWALGVVATIAVTLAGFGWWANFKMYEDDKVRLKKELDASTRDALAKFETRINGNEKELLLRVDERLESAYTRVDKGLESVRRRLEKSDDSSVSRAKDTLNYLENLVSICKLLSKRTSEVEAIVREVEEHIWDLKDIPTNILLTQSKTLEAAIAADSGEATKSALGRMKETIQSRILPGNHSLPKTALNSILKYIVEAAKIDPVLSADVQALVMKIKEVSGASDA
jgi:hypothetical protein